MKSKGRIRRIVLFIVLGSLTLCLGLVGLSVLSNLLAPSHSAVTDRLSDQDKARLVEALRLKQNIGDSVWPGWGHADIPVILYNEEYAFLIGYPNPPPGWVKVPQQLARGGPWERVPAQDLQGQPYYRQRLPSSDVTPEAFTVLVGGRWVASMPTREWFTIALGEPLREQFGPILPYRLAARFLAGSTDKYISLILHESFHAYVGATAPERLATAEWIVASEKDYPWNDEKLRAAWRTELNLLAAAVQTGDRDAQRQLAREFLAQRSARRLDNHLNATAVDVERQREWQEGLAKYTELEMWRRAAAGNYTPGLTPAQDSDFNNYTLAEQSWAQEVDQLKRMADNLDDNCFYYSGMAQSVLLDHLMPGWQTRILTENTTLEDLVREAVR